MRVQTVQCIPLHYSLPTRELVRQAVFIQPCMNPLDLDYLVHNFGEKISIFFFFLRKPASEFKASTICDITS